MNGYAAAVRQFYDIYRPIARKYGLRMSSHTSIYDDDVETPDTCTGEMKEPCFTCDYCKHYDGKGTDRRLQDCDKYIVTDEHARRLRRHIKIINRRKAHQ